MSFGKSLKGESYCRVQELGGTFRVAHQTEDGERGVDRVTGDTKSLSGGPRTESWNHQG